jgi:hypothetical protein
VLIAGGDGSGTVASDPLNSAELYDPPSNSFPSSDTSTMNVAREYATATLLPNGLVLIAGGVTSSGGSPVDTNTTELYNPVFNSFAVGPNMNAARHLAAAALLPNGKVFIAGGETGTSTHNATVLNSTELYDPVANSFAATNTPTLNVGRYGTAPAIVLPNGQVLIAGGLLEGGYNFSEYDLKSIELYTP